MKGTTEHTEYTESRSAKEPSVCSVYSVVGKGTTEHTEYTESRSAKEPSVCSVYSVVECMFVDANERVGELGEVLR